MITTSTENAEIKNVTVHGSIVVTRDGARIEGCTIYPPEGYAGISVAPGVKNVSVTGNTIILKDNSNGIGVLI